MAGSAHGTREQRRFTFTEDVKFHAGKNRISLLSVAVGLPVSSPIPTQKTWVGYEMGAGQDTTSYTCLT